MRLRREFYSKHPDQLPLNPQDRGELTEQFIYSSDETICLSLEYADDDVKDNKEEENEEEEEAENENGSQVNGKRFLRCPAAVTVGLLKRLIRGKYGLDSNHALDILYGDSFLCDEYSLVDLAYIYNWRRKGPMRLRYRIYQRLETPSTLVNGTNGTEKISQEIKQEEKVENNETAKEIQLEISESGVMSVLNVDTRNGIAEETHSAVFPTANETIVNSEEKKANSPKPESNAETTTQDIISSKPEPNGDADPAVCSDDAKTIASPKMNTPSTAMDAATTDTVVNSTTPNSTAAVRNKNPVSLSSHKTLKPSPSSWNQNSNRVGIKRSSSVAASNDSSSDPTPAKRATPSSPTKAPRFFKVRNSSQPNSTDNNAVNCKASGTSIASVTESPVQEVAVNLTKVPSSPKKPADKERSSREGRVPSPRPSADSSLINPIRPYSAPAPSQSKRQPSPSLAAEDAAARLRHLMNPISSSSSPATSSSSNDSSVQHLGFPSAAAAWLNLARGAPNRQVPLPLGTGSPFSNRPPLSPAHFLSSFIASHPHYLSSPSSYLSPMSLPPPPDGKKPLPASTSSSSSPVSQQSHKPISPRTSTSFPTPTFNLNALQQCAYPPGLSPLLPNLPRELVGSFYHSSYVPRPFMSSRGNVRGSLSVSPKSLSSTSPVSSSSGGGFHPSLPPTVTSATSNNSSSTTGKKSSSGLRPIVPRRTVAPPPPLVPIGTTPGPTVRSPPTLLPIKDVVDKEPPTTKATSTSTASNCVKVVESCVLRASEDVKSGPESTTSEPVDSRVDGQDSLPKENGKVSAEVEKVNAETPTPQESTNSSKMEANSVKEVEKNESKVEVTATAAL